MYIYVCVCIYIYNIHKQKWVRRLYYSLHIPLCAATITLSPLHTLLYHKFMKKISLQDFTDITTSHNCSSYVSGSSICKVQGGDFAFCLWHEFSATLCPHCWSSTFWSLHNWKVLFSWGSWKSLGTKCTIILVLQLCLKRHGIASRSISFKTICLFSILSPAFMSNRLTSL